MKRQWHPDELAAHFSITPEEDDLVAGKGRKYPNRLGFALLLKFFQVEGRFPKYKYEVPTVVVEHIARALDLSPRLLREYNWTGRTIKSHRAQIRKHLGFRKTRKDDYPVLTQWLLDEVLAADTHPEFVREQLLTRCRALKIEPPSPGRVERIMRSAHRQYEQGLCRQVYARLSRPVCQRLDALLEPYEAFQ